MNPECENKLNEVAVHLLFSGKCESIDDGIKKVVATTGFCDTNSRNPDYQRLSWDQYFMSLAYLVSMRSPDAQTQHGCVLVDHKNKIIATGYNGFLPDAEDACMPNLRPHKYQHIIHAEVNAILSAAQNLEDCKIYITGLPCNECLKMIAKSGIKEIIVGDRMHKFADGYFELQSLICVMHKINIRKFCGQLAHLDGRIITEHNHESN